MTGAGLSPFGTAPAGVGLPVTSPALVAAGYQMSTTGAVSSVKIDQVSKDVCLDANGSELGMSDQDQRVYMLCTTFVGSRANFQRDGLGRPDAAGGVDLQLQVENLYRAALAPAINDGSIRLDSVTIELDHTKPNIVYAQAYWFDLTTGTSHTTKTPLQF